MFQQPSWCLLKKGKSAFFGRFRPLSQTVFRSGEAREGTGRGDAVEKTPDAHFQKFFKQAPGRIRAGRQRAAGRTLSGKFSGTNFS
ncbi:MAG TPA: hypothetical protein IAB50_12740 [Candidatus Faecivicinus avistercoris]|nr:hypothetical protein [Candidatus Faecivicinus avistercoris]